MPSLDDIPIRVESPPQTGADFGNALPILNEIRHALGRLNETGEPSQIDLAAIPFGPGDEARLLELLGRGEVEATVDALGPTQVWETRFSGVWVVDYANADAQRVALQIEVDVVPQILRTQHADIADAIKALDERLADAASGAVSKSIFGTSEH
ncbi:MAG: hydrogenase expression/formation protein [Thiohalocapsa sp.]|nr:hydrogenase expression/formation protein [Thiohalocapsa sp.]MCF7992346.1 hydrogenase expression/formation protein [Thiohalocapsa sp.]